MQTLEDGNSVHGFIYFIVVMMESSVFRSTENCDRRVIEGCPYVSETRRTVLEACLMAFDKWCFVGTDELFFIVKRLKRGAFIVLRRSLVLI